MITPVLKHACGIGCNTNKDKEKESAKKQHMAVNTTSTIPVDRVHSPKGSCLLAANILGDKKKSNSRECFL